MTETNKTLYIPLYGKAFVSRKGIILSDKTAEYIWENEGFQLKGKSKSKWLAYYMAMRARVFDEVVEKAVAENPHAAVLHIGCGMDSRYQRIQPICQWYDIDFPAVTEERRKYFSETDNYHMYAADATQAEKWLTDFSYKTAVVVMEGVSMYLTKDQINKLVADLQNYFDSCVLIADFYSEFAAKMSKYKNPVNDVGATIYSGMDDPYELVINSGVSFVKEWDMTPDSLISELSKAEQRIFRNLYAGRFAKGLYKLFQYRIEKAE